jgi:hypothetical protein
MHRGEDDAKLDPADFAEQIVEDVRNNQYNFRIQFNKDKPYNMTFIKKLSQVLETRQAGMLWPDRAIKMYPDLIEENKVLDEAFNKTHIRSQL